MLLTRPLEASQRFADAVPEVPSVISPILRIVPLSPVLPDAPAPVIFTSANGVWAFLQLRAAADQVAYCVGPRTARVAQDGGFRAISANGAVDDLEALIRAERPVGPLIYACGKVRTGDLDDRLRQTGSSVITCEVYDQAPQRLTETAQEILASARTVILPLFSPRSAALMSGASQAAKAPLHLVFLSENVAAAWSGPPPKQYVIAPAPNMPAMVETVKLLVGTRSSG
nr:uroporphyrinogen-III synthase [Actibacterium sp. 188UL27-1]